MAEYREVHTYDHDVATDNSTAMVIFIVAVLALLTVGLILWQPWAAPAQDTTIITQPAPSNPPDTTIINPPNNTIVNPPSETEINVTPPPSKTEVQINPPPSGETTTIPPGG